MGIPSRPKTAPTGNRVNSLQNRTPRPAPPPVFRPAKPAAVSKSRFEPNPALAAVQARMSQTKTPRPAPPPVFRSAKPVAVSKSRFEPNPALAAVQARMSQAKALRPFAPPAYQPAKPLPVSKSRFESKDALSGIQAKMVRSQPPVLPSPPVFSPPGPAPVKSFVVQQTKRKKSQISKAQGLNAKEVHGKKNKQEGYCGNFKRVRNWKVVTSVEGVIVQEVERTFNVTQVGGFALAGSALDSYVKDPGSKVNATENKYWELWTVDSSGKVSDGSNDTFGLCSLIPWDGISKFDVSTHVKNTTQGSFEMKGKAQFYETNELPKDIGFPLAAVKSAGGLPSTTIDPAVALALKGAKAVGSQVKYKVTVTWDSNNSHKYYSKVTSTSS